MQPWGSPALRGPVAQGNPVWINRLQMGLGAFMTVFGLCPGQILREPVVHSSLGPPGAGRSVPILGNVLAESGPEDYPPLLLPFLPALSPLHPPPPPSSSFGCTSPAWFSSHLDGLIQRYDCQSLSYTDDTRFLPSTSGLGDPTICSPLSATCPKGSPGLLSQEWLPWSPSQ